MRFGMNVRRRATILAAALWWGCLTGLGFVAVPVVFASLPGAAIAGPVAAQLFTAQSWVSLACGALLLLLLKGRSATGPTGRERVTLLLVAAGMLLALLVEYVAAPHIRARDHLAVWHTAGTAMYVAQWLCAGVVLWRQAGGQASKD